MARYAKALSHSSKTAGWWTVQILGELLITLGLVLLLFIAWQLWWTNIDSNRAQGQAVNSLAQEFKQAATSPESPKNSGGGQEESVTTIPGNWDPNNPEVTAEPPYGQAFGIVYIPRLGESYQRPAAEGTGSDVLDTLGLGHYEGTAMPGDIGNFALAGHRQTNGAVLDHIDRIQNGDRIYVQTLQGYYTYTVYESKIVLPTDIEVIAPNPDNPTVEASERLLTLTTCHPRFGDSERYIVHARLESWQPPDAGAPDEIADAVASQ